MKKRYFVIVLALLVVLLCACRYATNADDHDEELLARVYEVDDGIYDAENEFNHGNLISNQVEHFDDQSASKNKKIQFDNVKKEFSYQDSLRYPVGGNQVRRYIENGTEDHVVLLNPDDTVYALLFKFAFLDISPTNTPEEILPILEAELMKWVDLSVYEYINIPEATSRETGFGTYRFMFYNALEGYITDYVTVAVADDGGVLGFYINDLNYSDLALDIDPELEAKMLGLKMKDIYDTDSTRYVSYETHFQPTVVIYNGMPHIQYFVSATYLTPSDKMMESWINTILIPVDMITAVSEK